MVETTALCRDQVIEGDCLAAMARLPDGSVDLVFADPPYNLQLGGELHRPDNSRVDGVEDGWDKFADFAEYDRFTRAWLGAARRVLKPDGALWVIGSYHNIFRVGAVAAGSRLLDPQRRRLAQDQPDAEFPRPALHQRARDADLVRRSTRGALHLQLRGDEGAQRRTADAQRLADPAVRRARAAAGRRRRSKAHPTQKPEALLHRVLLASTRPGDVVLDPFFGTGTTGAVAKRLGPPLHRHRARPGLCRAGARAHRGGAGRRRPISSRSQSRREAPRVPFGSLVERGLLQPGEVLFDQSAALAARGCAPTAA